MDASNAPSTLVSVEWNGRWCANDESIFNDINALHLNLFCYTHFIIIFTENDAIYVPLFRSFWCAIASSSSFMWIIIDCRPFRNWKNCNLTQTHAIPITCNRFGNWVFNKRTDGKIRLWNAMTSNNDCTRVLDGHSDVDLILNGAIYLSWIYHFPYIS